MFHEPAWSCGRRGPTWPKFNPLTGEMIQGWDEDFAALWIEAMDEANLWEKKKECRRRGVPVSSCFRKAWRAFLRGRQRQRTVRAQNKQNNSKNSCEIWGGMIGGPFCACKNSRRQTSTW